MLLKLNNFCLIIRLIRFRLKSFAAKSASLIGVICIFVDKYFQTVSLFLSYCFKDWLNFSINSSFKPHSKALVLVSFLVIGIAINVNEYKYEDEEG